METKKRHSQLKDSEGNQPAGLWREIQDKIGRLKVDTLKSLDYQIKKLPLKLSADSVTAFHLLVQMMLHETDTLGDLYKHVLLGFTPEILGGVDSVAEQSS